MSYTIRHLTAADVPMMHDLMQLFSDVFEDPASYRSKVPSDEYFRTLLAKPSFVALVALDGEKVVGGLAAYVWDKYEQERSETYIYDLAVDANYRRQGIATALINALKPIVKEQGSWVIMVQADPGDDPAIKLYESLGTREDVHHFDIAVS